MRRRKLGQLEVSTIGMGCINLSFGLAQKSFIVSILGMDKMEYIEDTSTPSM